MRYLIILALILTGCSSGGGGGDSTQVTESGRRVIDPTLFILGDSLCVPEWSWANTLDYDKNVMCHGGWRAVQEEYVDIALSFEADIFINALGVNDAVWIHAGKETIEEFKAAYVRHNDQAEAKGMRVICLMPPLTEWPDIQPYVMQIHDVIQSVCSEAIHSTPSDYEDGAHYTQDGQDLNRQIIESAI